MYPSPCCRTESITEDDWKICSRCRTRFWVAASALLLPNIPQPSSVPYRPPTLQRTRSCSPEEMLQVLRGTLSPFLKEQPPVSAPPSKEEQRRAAAAIREKLTAYQAIPINQSNKAPRYRTVYQQRTSAGIKFFGITCEGKHEEIRDDAV